MVTATVAVVACARTDLRWIDDQAASDAIGEAWGDYAARLDVPDCPASNIVLTVDTAADELDGGIGLVDAAQAGSSLSLLEAMWIAYNRGTPHSIVFDPEIFPVSTPRTILLSGSFSAPVLSDACLDARARGVVVEWAEGLLPCCFGVGDCQNCIWDLDGSTMVGLTVLHPPDSISVLRSQVAGCRLGSDGREVYADPPEYLLSLEESAVVGPGNVFAIHTGFGFMQLFSNDDAQISDNFFGYDPLTRTALPGVSGTIAIRVWGTAEIYNNTFGCFSEGVYGASSAQVNVHDNRVGVDLQGAQLAGCDRGGFVTVPASGEFVVGPGNVIAGTDRAVLVSGAGAVQVTRNSIYGNDRAIWYFDGVPFAPPTLLSADGSQVTGTCPVAGTVEVFSDSGDEAETYLGTVACDGVAPWVLAASVPSGRYVTATLTVGNDTSELASSVVVP